MSTGQPSNPTNRPLRLSRRARRNRRARTDTWLSTATFGLALALPVTASAQIANADGILEIFLAACAGPSVLEIPTLPSPRRGWGCGA